MAGWLNTEESSSTSHPHNMSVLLLLTVSEDGRVMSTRHLLALGAALGVVLGACGDGDGTGPNPVDIAGTWSLAWTNMSGSGIRCQTSAIEYQIVQNGTTFTGNSNSTYTLSCTDGITTLTDTLTGAIITNGRITGNTVSFDLASSAAHQSGTVSGDTMSGTATWTLDLGTSGTIILRGPFAGHRV